MEDLASFIYRLAYSPHEEIKTNNQLNVLTVGMATRGTSMIQAGASFGDIILSSLALRDTTPARTMIYCEAGSITRDNLLEALEGHPEAQSVIHQASIKLALSRAMVVISLHVNMRNLRKKRAAAPTLHSAERPAEPAAKPGNELKETLHPFLGAEWRELNYGEDGKPIIVEQSKTGLGPDADNKLEEIIAAPQTSQLILLAKMLLSTNSRLDALTEAVTNVVHNQNQSAQAQAQVLAQAAASPSWSIGQAAAPARATKPLQSSGVVVKEASEQAPPKPASSEAALDA